MPISASPVPRLQARATVPSLLNSESWVCMANTDHTGQAGGLVLFQSEMSLNGLSGQQPGFSGSGCP